MKSVNLYGNGTVNETSYSRKLNIIADKIYRTKEVVSSEWRIDLIVLKHCFERFSFMPDSNLLASKLKVSLREICLLST